MPMPSLTYQLAAIAGDAIGAAERLFVERFGLTIHELRVLRLIGDNPDTTFTWLTSATKIERSATSRILSRLIKAGFVRREIDDADARQFLLRITAKGRNVRAKADPLTEELESLLLSCLDEGERTRLTRTLGRLSDWLAGGFPSELAKRYRELGPDAARPSRATGGKG